MAEMVEDLRAGFETVHMEVALLKCVFLNQPQLGVVDCAADDVSGKLKVPKWKKFEGTTSAKDLENFILDIRAYYTTAKIPEHRQMLMTRMFMIGDAKLWYW